MAVTATALTTWPRAQSTATAKGGPPVPRRREERAALGGAAASAGLAEREIPLDHRRLQHQHGLGCHPRAYVAGAAPRDQYPTGHQQADHGNAYDHGDRRRHA